MIRLLRLILDEDILIVLFMIGFSFLVVELVLLLNGVGLWDWLRFDLERLLIFLNEAKSLTIPTRTEELDNYEIPTKLITITYNNETIESYE